MSELAKRDPNQWETSIERYDKKLTIKLGDSAIVFTFLNTQLYEHGAEYPQFDHIFRVNDNQDQGRYFLRDDYPELYDVLVQHEFPRKFSAYPTEQDERVIGAHLAQQTVEGLEKLLEGGNE